MFGFNLTHSTSKFIVVTPTDKNDPLFGRSHLRPKGKSMKSDNQKQMQGNN